MLFNTLRKQRESLKDDRIGVPKQHCYKLPQKQRHRSGNPQRNNQNIHQHHPLEQTKRRFN